MIAPLRMAMLAVLAASVQALAADPATTAAREAQLEALRGEVAGQLQLQSFDLLDELVYGWVVSPPFANETALVLADVSVPVGFGSGLQAMIENHFTELLTKNHNTHVVLTHCPQCTALVVHSGAKGTTVSRGVDEPETLASAGAGAASHHAVFLDFEAEGPALVLRARITALEPSLPIVYAKTLSTSTSSPALLRSPDKLKSAAEARKEYLDILENRSMFTVPVRVGMRSYAQPSGANFGAMPFFWLNLGLEVAPTQTRAWLLSASLGFSWMPELHVGWSATGRVERLLSGSVSSLTGPDLYGFLGVGFLSIHGKSAYTFLAETATIQDILNQVAGKDPDALFGVIQFGLEVRVKNRLGFGAFAEWTPGLNDTQTLGKFIDIAFFSISTLGLEVSFCF